MNLKRRVGAARRQVLKATYPDAGPIHRMVKGRLLAGLDPSLRDLEPEEMLSQYGDARGFRDRARLDALPGDAFEKTVSMTLGVRTAEEVYRAMMGRPPKPGRSPAVRHFRAGTLNEAEYETRLQATPTNADHVAVGPLLASQDDVRLWWADNRRATLTALAHVPQREAEGR